MLIASSIAASSSMSTYSVSILAGRPAAERPSRFSLPRTREVRKIEDGGVAVFSNISLEFIPFLGGNSSRYKLNLNHHRIDKNGGARPPFSPPLCTGRRLLPCCSDAAARYVACKRFCRPLACTLRSSGAMPENPHLVLSSEACARQGCPAIVWRSGTPPSPVLHGPGLRRGIFHPCAPP